MDEQKQQLSDAFSSLPKALQESISSSDVQAKLRDLAEVHKLHLDKWSLLENEIMMVLLGLTEPNDLAKNISKETGLPLEQSQEITDSVTKIIFTPIQEKLRETLGESRSALETIDSSNPAIDISKFSPAPTDPSAYNPKLEKKYADNNDPYHEAIE